MGDYTCETIYQCSAADAAHFRDNPDPSDPFAGLANIHETASKRTGFRGYSYDHDRFLPDLVKLFAPNEPLALTDYAERPCILFRVVDAADVATQANAILNLIAHAHDDPSPLIPIIRTSVAQVVTFFEGAVTKTGQDPFSMRKHQEGLDNSRRALEQFSLTADDIRTVFDLAKIGGFYPDDAPKELSALDKLHCPHSPLITSLAQSFGFLKTLVLTYEDAADAREAIVHLQTYGT